MPFSSFFSLSWIHKSLFYIFWGKKGEVKKVKIAPPSSIKKDVLILQLLEYSFKKITRWHRKKDGQTNKWDINLLVKQQKNLIHAMHKQVHLESLFFYQTLPHLDFPPQEKNWTTKKKIKKWFQCYYSHRSRDSVSPVCGI